jgi:membrane protein DedA with SNARE-associated domain
MSTPMTKTDIAIYYIARTVAIVILFSITLYIGYIIGTVRERNKHETHTHAH